MSEVNPPQLPSEPGKRRGRPPRSHTVAKVLSITVLCLGLITAMTVAFVVRGLQNSLEVEDVEKQLTDRPLPEVEGAFNILVMGSDSRAGANNVDGDKSEGARSDTTILLHLSEDRQRAYGVSIPRDTMVPRPDCILKNGETVAGSSRAIWNDAFFYGGPACTIQQFEQLTGVRIDHFVVIDFNGFKGMVDAIGGVEVCLNEPVDDTEHNITLAAGRRMIDGEEALAFVRVRSGIGDGSDLSRIKRQQSFVASMAKQVLSAQTLADPIKVVGFAQAVTRSITVSKSLANIQDIAALGFEFRDIKLKKVQFVTAPWQLDPLDTNRVVLKPEAEQLWERIRQDLALTKAQGAGGIKASDPQNGSTDGPNKDDQSAQEAEAAGLCA